MATKKQKEQLIDILKFTPTTVTINISGYGGETYAGRVSRETYEFFKQHRIDIEEYASNWDDEFNNVPESLQPFTPGSPYECDGIYHESGAELTNLNMISVYDDKGNVIWESSLGLGELEEQDVSVDCMSEDYISECFDDSHVVFAGGNGEKGCFFDGEVTLRAPFDPAKLRITYYDCDGWELVTGVEYDGEDIDGSGGYSTSGKWTENKWVLPDGVEEYEPISVEDRDMSEDLNKVAEVDYEQELQQLKAELDAIEVPKDFDWSALPDEPEVTDWFESDVKPVRKGTYEAVIDAPWPLSGVRMVEWSGRGWKEDGKKVLIKQWRGLAENPEA